MFWELRSYRSLWSLGEVSLSEAKKFCGLSEVSDHECKIICIKIRDKERKQDACEQKRHAAETTHQVGKGDGDDEYPVGCHYVCLVETKTKDKVNESVEGNTCRSHEKEA